MNYTEFLEKKNYVTENSGFDISIENLSSELFDFEKDIVRWALAKGKACVFAACGLGKTLMQLEVAHRICQKKQGAKVLIFTPLTVAPQTKEEGKKTHLIVNLCESQEDVVPGINVTNYEKIDRFVASEFDGVILDESSILKSYSGSVRNKIITWFKNVPSKFAFSATPAPNDYMELGNHAEFCDVMSRSEMLSTFFVHDGGDTSKWRLKRHAEGLFWEWLSTFCVFIDNPKDLGYEADGYDLPKLHIHEIVVDGDEPVQESLTLTERREARKESLEARCMKAAELVNTSDEQWLVWCDLNAESAMLHKLMPDSVEVKGSDKNDYKEKSLMGFSNGDVRVLVTKPSIAGFGMNWQNCHNMIFTGLSDSYEQYYQAVRRCWRFGQTEEVNVYIIISKREGCVKQNIERKEADFLKMKNAMIEYTKEITKKNLAKTCRLSTPYEANVEMVLPKWEEFAS